MPSSSQSLPPPIGAAKTPGSAKAPVNPLHALFGAIILALLGALALAVDIYGLALVLSVLLFAAGGFVAIGAAVLALSRPRSPRRRPAPVAGNDLRTKLNNAGFEDGMCS